MVSRKKNRKSIPERAIEKTEDVLDDVMIPQTSKEEIRLMNAKRQKAAKFYRNVLVLALALFIGFVVLIIRKYRLTIEKYYRDNELNQQKCRDKLAKLRENFGILSSRLDSLRSNPNSQISEVELLIEDAKNLIAFAKSDEEFGFIMVHGDYKLKVEYNSYANKQIPDLVIAANTLKQFKIDEAEAARKEFWDKIYYPFRKLWGTMVYLGDYYSGIALMAFLIIGVITALMRNFTGSTAAGRAFVSNFFIYTFLLLFFVGFGLMAFYSYTSNANTDEMFGFGALSLLSMLLLMVADNQMDHWGRLSGYAYGVSRTSAKLTFKGTTGILGVLYRIYDFISEQIYRLLTFGDNLIGTILMFSVLFYGVFIFDRTRTTASQDRYIFFGLLVTVFTCLMMLTMATAAKGRTYFGKMCVQVIMITSLVYFVCDRLNALHIISSLISPYWSWGDGNEMVPVYIDDNQEGQLQLE